MKNKGGRVIYAPSAKQGIAGIKENINWLTALEYGIDQTFVYESYSIMLSLLYLWL